MAGPGSDELLSRLAERAHDPIRRTDSDVDDPQHSLPSPATRADVDEAERHLGFELPHLLVRIYLEVANGGFGPGFGLLGVNGGWTDSDMDLVEWALLKRTRRQRQCRLILCHHGCAVYSIVNCTTPDLEVLRRDGSCEPTHEESRDVGLAAWFWSWATDDPLPLPDTFAQELYALFSGHGINSHELYLELESIEEAHEAARIIQLALPADDPEFPGRLSKTMHIWESHRRRRSRTHQPGDDGG